MVTVPVREVVFVFALTETTTEPLLLPLDGATLNHAVSAAVVLAFQLGLPLPEAVTVTVRFVEADAGEADCGLIENVMLPAHPAAGKNIAVNINTPNQRVSRFRVATNLLI